LDSQPSILPTDDELKSWVESLNKLAKRTSCLPTYGTAVFLLGLYCGIFIIEFPLVYIIIIAVTLVLIGVTAFLFDKARNHVELSYNQHLENRFNWQQRQRTLDHLACQSTAFLRWGQCITFNGQESAWHNAQQIQVSKDFPRGLKTNGSSVLFSASASRFGSNLHANIYFLPDRLVISRGYQNQNFGAVLYENIDAKVVPVAVDQTTVPGDGLEVLNETWLYTRRDGLPDRRYSYNPKIYTVRFWAVCLASDSGLSLSIAFTDKETADDLVSLSPRHRSQATSSSQSSSAIDSGTQFSNNAGHTDRLIISCPVCKRQLRIPRLKGVVTCPSPCNYTFSWDPDSTRKNPVKPHINWGSKDDISHTDTSSDQLVQRIRSCVDAITGEPFSDDDAIYVCDCEAPYHEASYKDITSHGGRCVVCTRSGKIRLL